MRSRWVRELLRIRIDSGWLPVGLFVLVCIGMIVLLVLSFGATAGNDASGDDDESKQNGEARRRSFAIGGPFALAGHRAWWMPAGVVLGFVGGFGIAFLLDRLLVFGVELGIKVDLVIGLGCAIVGALVAAVMLFRGRRRVLAATLIPFAVLSCVMNVNGVYGEYPTVGSVLGISTFREFDPATIHRATTTVEQWNAAAERGSAPQAPKHGMVASVFIPATESGFRARAAVVYLPPAALVDNPPELPVFIMMAGQPGSPDRAFLAGHLKEIFDDYAAAHHGLAPIVVSPDQLGNAFHNTLCVDSSKYGNAETYLTRDVTNWITSTLPVETDADHWAIGGFSQGGTCTIQLGPSHPDLYGHMFTVGAELGPHNGSEQSMIRTFFNGDEQAYRRHVPIDIMRARGHSSQTLIMSAGELDDESVSNITQVAGVAQGIGMDVTTFVVTGTGHDWHTVQSALRASVDRLGAQLGLGGEARPLQDFNNIRPLDVATISREEER
ncbi:alpha/beta hydrolase [Bifidobacterium vansinderenii]|uniref:Esterase n=1 Tax=Bifidobacterium vansinderenii TaxID=1984871 RepID=A0A229VV17_9BIFI|nr:alpha/beta hydrolase-fold protein [Bifidobacterium vansinderenii]OXM99463.1 esterase [Bifidobacterium vansinderenii]